MKHLGPEALLAGFEDIRFVEEPTARNIDGAVDLMRQHQEGYPGGQAWVDRTVAELENGSKHLLLGLYNGHPVTDVVWKVDPEDAMVLDLRHFSSSDQVARRLFGAFAVRQVEVRSQVLYPSVAVAMGTAKAANATMRRFAAGQGYRVQTTTILGSPYGTNGQPDVVFVKALGDKLHL